MRNAGLISLVLALLASCAIAEVGNDEPEVVASFSSSWIKLLRYAEDDYLRNEGDSLSCFDIYFDESERERIVSFISSDSVQSNGDEFTFTTGSVTECGLGVSYFFDATNGKFVKKAYQR